MCSTVRHVFWRPLFSVRDVCACVLLCTCVVCDESVWLCHSMCVVHVTLSSVSHNRSLCGQLHALQLANHHSVHNDQYIYLCKCDTYLTEAVTKFLINLAYLISPTLASSSRRACLLACPSGRLFALLVTSTAVQIA